MKRQKGEAKTGVVITLAGTSGGGAFISFFADTLVIVQWLGAVVALASGIAALILTVKNIRKK